MRDKIKEWHQLVVIGLNKGLTHTIPDGRLDDIDWVRKRLKLWESFGRCVMDLETNQNYQYSEKDLKEVAEAGFPNRENKELCECGDDKEAHYPNDGGCAGNYDTCSCQKFQSREQDAPVDTVNTVNTDEVKDRYGKVVTGDEKEIKKGLDKDYGN